MRSKKEQQSRGLSIEAAGLCCSLGYHLDAVNCALRANMDHFQESAFYNLAGDPLTVAMLPDELYGYDRLVRWAEYAVLDCARHMAEPMVLFDKTRTSVIVMAPDESRAQAELSFYKQIAVAALQTLRNTHGIQDDNEAIDEKSVVVIPQGRTGLGPAVTMAATMLTSGSVDKVLLISSDSYLNASDINAALQSDRLLSSTSSTGFIPGEGAAALVLCCADTNSPGLHVRGVGMAVEEARLDGITPNRSMGLTRAIRAAATQANVPPSDLALRMSDQNGEPFYSDEGTNAMTRFMFGAGKLPHLTIADKAGELGVAAGPAMLAWLWRGQATERRLPQEPVLIHLANDDGSRCALVLNHISA